MSVVLEDRLLRRYERSAKSCTDKQLAEILLVIVQHPRLMKRAEKDIYIREAASRLEQKRVFLG